MSYKIDGVDIPKPTTGKWDPRDTLGNDGYGKPSYPGVRSFAMTWEYIDMADANTIYGLFNAKAATGTHVVSLPQYNAGTWTFKEYSGCQMTEPEFGDFFEEHVSDFKVLLVRIAG